MSERVRSGAGRVVTIAAGITMGAAIFQACGPAEPPAQPAPTSGESPARTEPAAPRAPVARVVPVFPIGDQTDVASGFLVEMLAGSVDSKKATIEHFEIRFAPGRWNLTRAFALMVADEGKRCLLEANFSLQGQEAGTITLKRGLPLADGGALATDVVLPVDARRGPTTLPATGKIDGRFRPLILGEPVSQERLAALTRRYPRLRQVRLDATNLTDLSPLARLTDLVELRMGLCLGITDLSPLQGLGRLSRLSMTSCRGLKDLTPLTRLKSLTVLTLYRCPQVADLTPLGKLHGLKALLLYDFDAVEDLAPLSGLKNLRQLSIALFDNVDDLSPLTGLEKLAILDAGGMKKLSDVSPLARMTQLEVLLLYRTKVTDLSPLAGLRRLRQLSLGGLEGVEDLSPLAGMTELRILTMPGCKKVTDLTPLMKLQRLESVDLTACEGLSAEQIQALRRALPGCEIQTRRTPIETRPAR